MLLPSMALLFLVVLIWINSTLTLGLCRTALERKLLHPSQHQRVRERSFTKGKSMWQLTVTCFMVVFYFLYPSLIQHIANINTCDTYDWGGAAPGVLLLAPLCPPSVLCAGQELLSQCARCGQQCLWCLSCSGCVVSFDGIPVNCPARHVWCGPRCCNKGGAGLC